jgi:hypothetical protein
LNKYVLKFWFEHGGTCLWSANQSAVNKFGYAIDNETLPISARLVTELNALEDEYHTYLDWNDPPSPSPWTQEQKQGFIDRANATYQKLLSELGEEFELINKVDTCVT